MNKLIILIVLIFSGCVCTEEGYPEKNLFIKCRKEMDAYVSYGNANQIKMLDSFKIYKLKFYEARGGKSLFFGIVVKESDAYKSKRLALHENNQIKMEYSVNEILKFKTDKIDTMMVYTVPQ